MGVPDRADLYVTVAAMVVIALWTTLTRSSGGRTQSISEFLVVSRMMGPRVNAAAISGEYLSAASFLGIAGLVLKSGADALWYPVGFTAGYLALLLFVAVPLRRSGAYTLPDFAEVRLGSGWLRRICALFVVIIGWLYLVPQLQGPGLILHAVAHAPGWVGAAVVMVLVTFNVYTGWTRSITLVQALQYWIKLTTLAVPVFVLLIYHVAHHQGFSPAPGASAAPRFSHGVDIRLDHPVTLKVAEPTLVMLTGIQDGRPTDGMVSWAPGKHSCDKGSTLRFAAGSPVPVVSGVAVDGDWMRPVNQGRYPLLATYSLIAALLLGAMGLPHILGRYYTHLEGAAVRQTTLRVLALLGLFYLFPTISGWLARLYLPNLLVSGNTDAALPLLPRAALGGWPALVLGGLISAGAFAAFVSAATGVMVSIAGVLSTDVLPGRLRRVRAAVVAAWSVPLAFMLAVSSLNLAQGVGLAFVVAASSFCPLLVLGIWWRGLTDAGAAVGMLAGGGVALISVLSAAVGVLPSGWWELAAQPAVFTVPLAFLTMVAVSRRTRDRIPTDVSRILLRLHAPDRLGLSGNRQQPQPAVRIAMTSSALFRMREGRHRK